MDSFEVFSYIDTKTRLIRILLVFLNKTHCFNLLREHNPKGFNYCKIYASKFNLLALLFVNFFDFRRSKETQKRALFCISKSN